jgi:hypothetical protein
MNEFFKYTSLIFISLVGGFFLAISIVPLIMVMFGVQ